MTVAEKKIKKSLSDVMVFDSSELPVADMRGLSKWDLFKHLFIGKIGTMVILNLLTLLFALPALADIVIFTMTGTFANSYVPYSANVGIGYPVVADAVWQGVYAAYKNELLQFSILVPSLALLFMGLGGNMFVMRKLIWGEPAKPAKDFFRGIKKSWWQSFITGPIVGAAILAFAVSLRVFDVYKLHTAYKVLGIIASSIVLVAVSMYSAFFMAQSVSFKMKFADVSRNSILLALNSHVIGVFFVAVAVVPMLLLTISTLMMFVMIFYVMLGFSYTSIVLMLYCNGSFEKCLYDKATVGAVYGKRDDKLEKSVKGEKSEKVEKGEKADGAEAAEVTDGAQSVGDAETDGAAEQHKSDTVKKPYAYKNPKKGKRSELKSGK